MPSCATTYSGSVITNDCIATGATLPAGVVGDAYSETLTAPDLTAPMTWAVLNGTVPDGTQLDPDTGELYGVPTLESDYSFQVQVTDTNGLQCLKNFTLNVTAASSFWGDFPFEAYVTEGEPAGTSNYTPPGDLTGVTDFTMGVTQPLDALWNTPQALDIEGVKQYTGPAVDVNFHVVITANTGAPGTYNSINIVVYNASTSTYLLNVIPGAVGTYDYPVTITGGVNDIQVFMLIQALSTDDAINFQCTVTLSQS